MTPESSGSGGGDSVSRERLSLSMHVLQGSLPCAILKLITYDSGVGKHATHWMLGKAGQHAQTFVPSSLPTMAALMSMCPRCFIARLNLRDLRFSMASARANERVSERVSE